MSLYSFITEYVPPRKGSDNLEAKFRKRQLRIKRQRVTVIGFRTEKIITVASVDKQNRNRSLKNCQLKIFPRQFTLPTWEESPLS